MKKAILFDIDGTLLDAKQFIFKAFEHSLLTNYQKQISWKDLLPLSGKSLVSCYQQLVPAGDIEILCQTHHNFQLQNLHLAAPFPSSIKTLKKLRQRKFKLGAVTNRSGNTVIKTLQLSGLAKYLDIVITADDVKKQKPHKEPIIKALKLLEVKPHQAILVGDTEVDVLAGKNARVQTVGVTYGVLGKDIKKHNPDFIVNDIEELLDILK